MKTAILAMMAVLPLACASGRSTTSGAASGPAGPKTANTAKTALLDLHARTGRLMEAGDGVQAERLYDAQAVMVLTNGKVHRGADAIREVIEGAPKLAFRDATFDDVQVEVLKNGAYVRARFGFAMTLPNGQIIRPQGRRLSLWRPTDDGRWVVKVDVWVPDRPGPEPAVADAITRRVEALEAAYNAHDPRRARNLFDPQAVFALSDATVFEGPGVQGMLDFAFGAGLRDMRLEGLKMVDAGGAVMVGSQFGLRIGNDEVPPKTIEGCRLDVWTERDGGWTLLVELAQPTASATCLD